MNEQYGYPPAHHAPKKSSPFKAGLLGCLGVGVALLLVLGGCAAMIGMVGSSDDTSGGSDTEADAGGDSGGQGDGEEAAAIGDTVETDDFAYTVTDVEAGVESVTDSTGYLTEEPQGQFVIVSVTVENVGNQPGMFDSTSQTLVDADGNQHSTSVEAEITSDAEAFLNEINPGNTVEGSLIFDVPADAEPKTLELSGFLSLDAPAVVEL